MRTPSRAELLGIWEAGNGRPFTLRALLLIAAACDDRSWDEIAALSIGRRDALLLALRSRIFGARIIGVSACPQCSTTVEAEFTSTALLDEICTAPDSAEHELDIDGMHVRFRLPNSTDLLSIAAVADPADARRRLLERCVLSLDAESPRARDDSIESAVVRAMAAADSGADLRLAMQCPGCSHEWTAAFDVVRYTWKELHAWAARLLRDIDVLARVYHWRESDILSLSEERRRAYLELCAS